MKGIAAILLIALAGAPSQAGQTEWSSANSPPFTFYFLETDRMYLEQVVGLFETTYPEIVNKLGVDIRSPVSVFLAPTQNIFDQLTGNFIPDWGEGVADATRGVIILKSPTLSKNENHLPKLIRHELTHIIIGQAVGDPQILPRWFNEGMAIYCSADEEFTTGEAISKALISNSVVPLDEIDDVLKFHQAKAQLAYEESFSFTQYLIDEYGLDHIIQLIQECTTGKTFDAAFQEVFGLDLFDVELRWYDHIKKEYRWHFLLNFETYLWIFILLLFILTFVWIRFRNRRVIKRWEEEERFAG